MFVRRFGEIIGIVSLPKPVDLRQGEQPCLQADTLEPASKTRAVAEALATAGGAAAVGGLALMVIPPVGAALICAGGVMAGLAGLYWGIRRCTVSNHEGNLKQCMRKYNDLRENIVGASLEELGPSRVTLPSMRNEFIEGGFHDIYLALDLLILEHLVDRYEQRLGEGLRAAATANAVSPPPNLAEELIGRLADVSRSDTRETRMQLQAAETRLLLPIARAPYERLKDISTQIVSHKETFERCKLTEMYFRLRTLILTRTIKKLESHSFALTDLNQTPHGDGDSDSDADINY